MPTPHKEKMCDGSGQVYIRIAGVETPIVCPGCLACRLEKEKREDAEKEKIVASCVEHNTEFFNEGKLCFYRPDECSKCHPTPRPSQGTVKDFLVARAKSEIEKHGSYMSPEELAKTIVFKMMEKIENELDHAKAQERERVWEKVTKALQKLLPNGSYTTQDMAIIHQRYMTALSLARKEDGK